MEEEGIEERLSFMDQCTVICLGYISAYGDIAIQSKEVEDSDRILSLCAVVSQELQEFGKKEELQNLLDSSTILAKEWSKRDKAEEMMRESVFILQNSLDQESFNECANELIKPPVESWTKVARILHLVHRASEQLGDNKLGAVVDVGVRYMRKTMSEFINNEGGWVSLTAKISQETEEGDISSSIVVVTSEGLSQSQIGAVTEEPMSGGDAAATRENQKDETSDETALDPCLGSPLQQTPAPLSPINTPQCSFPSSEATDDERDSLATPPELVERPLMTESYLQAMGDEARRISDFSGNGFEIIGSENGESSESPQQARSIDDVQAFTPPLKDEVTSQSQSTTASETSEEVKQDVEQTKEETSVLGGYLPHISLGVAFAAAAAGFFVLKKNM